MSHIRTQIRNKVATALDRLTTTQRNVFKGRFYGLQSAKLPALLVYTSSESAEVTTMGTGRNSDRILTLVVEGYAKSNAVVEDTLDKIAGLCLRKRHPCGNCLLLTSGRVSSEMTNKAARMGVPIVVSRTSPTSLAIELAHAWNITLIGYAHGNSLRVYTGEWRLISGAGLS